MPAQNYDIITVGCGIAASALAKAMAERGARVLVLERETKFKDRVRGEGLVCWGGGEARELGIYELLKKTCGHDVPFVESGMGLRDLTTTTPQRLPLLSFQHPVMQETLLAAAEQAGAEVRRGVTVEQIETGRTPAVITDAGNHERIAARLVVAADGRGSVARKWIGLAVQEQSNPFYMAGVLLTDVKAPTDTIYFIFNPDLGMCAVLIPLGNCRFRAYFIYPKTVGYRLQGDSMLRLFTSESSKVYPPLAEYYAEAKSIGPLASFDASDSWVEHPYRDGVVLVGDAAATTDPTFGQGRAARPNYVGPLPGASSYGGLPPPEGSLNSGVAPPQQRSPETGVPPTPGSSANSGVAPPPQPPPRTIAPPTQGRPPENGEPLL